MNSIKTLYRAKNQEPGTETTSASSLTSDPWLLSCLKSTSDGLFVCSKRGEAVKGEIPCWLQPVQGKSTKETDRVAAAKDSLHTFFSQRKYEKGCLNFHTSADCFVLVRVRRSLQFRLKINLSHSLVSSSFVFGS
jgi:hypothetical protein